MRSFRRTFSLSRALVNYFARNRVLKPSSPVPQPSGDDGLAYYLLFGVPVSSGTGSTTPNTSVEHYMLFGVPVTEP